MGHVQRAADARARVRRHSRAPDGARHGRDLACLQDHPRHPAASRRDRTQEATDFLVEHTGFERPNAEAEVQRYTFTPTYQLSYLLGKVLILRLRDDERRRLGDRFSLRAFHDALLWTGSIPISFHRRFLAGEGGGPFRPASGP